MFHGNSINTRPFSLKKLDPHELFGDVDKVVFPCGYTIAPDGDTIRIYYGAADTSIAMATGSIQGMLAWLRKQE